MPTTTTARTRRTTIDLSAALADTQPRDMLLLRLLEAHQVLSTPQIHTLLFPSLRVCQKRLARLRALGLMASFRRRDSSGRRQPAYWVLGPAGMRRQAIASGEPVPTDRTMRARRDRIVASPTLSHRLGINQFFVDLIAYARTRPGVELVRWWPEERATTLLRPVEPDGHGAWQVADQVWAWFVEFDTGSMFSGGRCLGWPLDPRVSAVQRLTGSHYLLRQLWCRHLACVSPVRVSGRTVVALQVDQCQSGGVEAGRGSCGLGRRRVLWVSRVLPTGADEPVPLLDRYRVWGRCDGACGCWCDRRSRDGYRNRPVRSGNAAGEGRCQAGGAGTRKTSRGRLLRCGGAACAR